MLTAVQWILGYAATRYVERGVIALAGDRLHYSTSSLLASGASYLLADRLLPSQMAEGAKVAAAWNGANRGLDVLAGWALERVTAEAPRKTVWHDVWRSSVGAQFLLNGAGLTWLGAP